MLYKLKELKSLLSKEVFPVKDDFFFYAKHKKLTYEVSFFSRRDPERRSRFENCLEFGIDEDV